MSMMTILVSDELHGRLKMQALKRGVTLQALVEERLDIEEESDGSDNRGTSGDGEKTG